MIINATADSFRGKKLNKMEMQR